MLFKYKAIKDGKLVINKIQAESQEAVLTFFKKINFTDIVDLTRQLAIMLDAGLTLIDALDILKKQETKPDLVNLLDNISKEIMSGKNFSSALSLYPQYFSNLYISLVKSGEASGKLSNILLTLSDNL